MVASPTNPIEKLEETPNFELVNFIVTIQTYHMIDINNDVRSFIVIVFV